MRRVIIAGGRDFDDRRALERIMERLPRPTRVLSGGASGADRLGEWWARRYRVPFNVYPARWDEHGKIAGPIRNGEMAESADVLVAFWNGKSRGTKNMIDTALRKGLEVHVIPYPAPTDPTPETGDEDG